MKYGIARGYFGVTENILAQFSKEDAKDFLFEMWTAGARIGYDEYKLWLQRLEVR